MDKINKIDSENIEIEKTIVSTTKVAKQDVLDAITNYEEEIVKFKELLLQFD